MGMRPGVEDHQPPDPSIGEIAMRSICLLIAAILPLGGWELNLAHGQESKGAKIAVFALDRPVTEAPGGDEFPFGPMGTEAFKDLVARIKKTVQDDQVKAVVLLPSAGGLGYGQIGELRSVMDQVKAAGKEIHLHADSLSMSQYVLASGASSISIVPEGILMIAGVQAEEPYLRGLLDKIGVTPDFMTCGDYKSAGEMFMRTGPSKQAEEMTNWLLDGLYETSVERIAAGRKVSPKKARQWIDAGLYTAAKAKKAGIIDTVEFRQDFSERLKSKYGSGVEFDKQYGKKKRDEIDLSSPLGLIKLWSQILQGPSKAASRKPAVAIVYVDGPILPGKPQPSPFGSSGIAYSEPIRRALDKAAEDDSIKGVVLRVNSPGGSATASEIILDATRRVKATKPLAVSMGNVAGSGGYYVACASDTIFAEAGTITASIGVVSGKFATTEMWNKIGIAWKPYKRGANAGMLSSSTVFSDAERKQMRALMDEIYRDFKAHVVAIRGDRLKKNIDELAGGRVFTGKQAHDLGLVDKLGGIEDAITHVARAAKIEDYEVRVLPKPKTFVEQLFSDLGGEEEKGEAGRIRLAPAWRSDSTSTWPPSSSLGTLARGRSLFEAALPYLEGLDPERVAAVKAALLRLSLVQQEGVMMAMPILEIRP